jgi:branched-subunit amino acid aminotransferase/4-amino-4-deoxychorismate lyase
VVQEPFHRDNLVGQYRDVSVVYLNGELVEAERATVPVLDRGLLSGYGLFETLRAYSGKPWALDEHHQRLCAGGELIELAVPTLGEVATAIAKVLEGNSLADAGVRLTITGGTGPVDVQSDPDGEPSLIVIAWPVRDYSRLYEEGAALVTIAEGGRPLAAVKTTSYAVSVAGRVLARRAGADDAVFLGGHKRVLEATGSNVFAVRGESMWTPPLDDAILPGVTRQCVIEVASRLGYDVVEQALYMDDLTAADEVVLTSSLREVYPARSIDGTELRRVGAAAKLRDAYRELVREKLGV